MPVGAGGARGTGGLGASDDGGSGGDPGSGGKADSGVRAPTDGGPDASDGSADGEASGGASSTGGSAAVDGSAEHDAAVTRPDGSVFGGALVYQQFTVPSAASAPMRITPGADGNVWFAESAQRRLGRITPGGTITEFEVPSEMPQVVTLGTDGNVWYAAYAAIGYVTPSGAVTEFSFPPQTFDVAAGIAAGADGNIWVPCSNWGKVARVTPAGALTTFARPSTWSGDIAAGPDGAVWSLETVREPYAQNVVRLSVDGSATPHLLSNDSTRFYATSITVGPDQNLWLTGTGNGWTCAIGRMTLTGELSLFPLPEHALSGCATDITAGADGALWFVAPGPRRIGRITPSGEITEFTIDQETGPWFITAGPDDHLWFTSEGANWIGRFSPNQ